MSTAFLEEGKMSVAVKKNRWTRRLSGELLAEIQIGARNHLPTLSIPRSMATSIGHLQSPSTSRPNSSRSGSSHSRYTPIGTLAGNDLGKSLAYVPPISEKDCMDELKEVLRKPLENVSRQRLRAILYGFRRKGGIENRISAQHMNSVLQEHEVRLSSRIVMLIRKGFEGKFGIDFESLWKLMCHAQALTGRDSVVCLYGTDKPPAVSRKQSVSGTGMDPRDQELINRLKHQFMSSRDHNLNEIRDLCEERDTLHHGILPSRVLRKICEEQRLPVSKPLLGLLLARCDDEKNGQISWTDFVGLLEKAYSDLPEPQGMTKPTKMRPGSGSADNNHLPSIHEKPRKGSGNKRKPAQRVTAKGKPPAGKPQPVSNPPPEDYLSNDEVDPLNASSGSSISKNSSGGESISLSGQFGSDLKEAADGEEPQIEREEKEETTEMKQESDEAGNVKGVEGISNGQAGVAESDSVDQNESSDKSKEPLNGGGSTSSLPPSGAKNKNEDKSHGKLRPLSGLADKIKAKVNKKTSKKDASKDATTGDSINNEPKDGVVKEEEQTESQPNGSELQTGATGHKTDGAPSLLQEDEKTPEEKKREGEEQIVGKDESNTTPQELKNEPEPDVVEYKAADKSLRFYKPDAYKGVEEPSQAPSQTLKLDWVYGYQGNDCRNNLYSLATGELVYFSANIVVLYDPLELTQRHYLAHESAVKSVAVHTNGTTVASGQAQAGTAMACVHIWNATNLQTVLVLGKAFFENGVTCLDFAASHGFLLAVDASTHPVLSVWDWKNGERLASTTLGTDVVCQVRFQPKDPSVIVSVGKEHLVFWNLDKEGGRLAEKIKPNYERNNKAKYVICVAFRPNGDIVTGDSNGTVYIWPRKSNTISHTLSHIHEGPVFALHFLRGLLLTGGRDGNLFAWTLGSRGAQNLSNNGLDANAGGVRVLAIAGSRIFIGTTMNCIFSLGITPSGPPFDSLTKRLIVTQGHYDEVNGLASLRKEPFHNHFLSVGYDGVIALIDGSGHTHLWRHWMKGINLLCVDAAVTSEFLAVGTREASLLLMSYNTSGCEEISKETVPEASPIVCIKFSPDGKNLVAGDEAGTVHVFQILKSGKQLKLCHHCKGHQGSIKSFDWSSDGRFVRSSSLLGEYYVWNMESFQQETNLKSRRNLDWGSSQSLHGFHCKGLWGEGSSSVTAVDVNKKQLLVAGMEDSKLDIHHFPSTKSDLKTSIPVLSGVSNLRFLSNEDRLVSVGGKSCCSLQWTVETEEEQVTSDQQP
ncbi:uncharacterized protein [Apostichopus japonicus]|uniref:uncharacterized protein isoform X2 n=1 Tax=Stichopus japonicus TaxID=307972 RepID=UPI003AB31516